MVRVTREKVDYSPAELALLDKFETIKERRALQEARNTRHDSSRTLQSLEKEKDARQIAIDIIRARRNIGSSNPNKGGTGGVTQKKTKIKLTSSSTVPKDTSNVSSARQDDDEAKKTKKRKVHVVQVRRRAAAQKEPEQQMMPGSSSQHALFIDNLPEHCTSDDLYRYFAEHWSVGVMSADVYQGCCSGLVVCTSLEDAEYIMHEQHEFEMGGNILSITWATEDDIKALDNNMGLADGPAPVDPRLQQRSLPRDTHEHTIDTTSQGDDDGQGRNVVSYDDL